MHRAQTDARDPLRREHRAWLEQQRTAFVREVRAVHATYAERLRQIEAGDAATKRAERRSARHEHDEAVRALLERHEPLSFVAWAAAHRRGIEQAEQRRRDVAAVRQRRAAAAARAQGPERTPEHERTQKRGRTLSW